MYQHLLIWLTLSKICFPEVMFKNSFQQMTSMKKNVGMGCFKLLSNKKGFGHSGAVDGFVSNLAIFLRTALLLPVVTMESHTQQMKLR